MVWEGGLQVELVQGHGLPGGFRGRAGSAGGRVRRRCRVRRRARRGGGARVANFSTCQLVGLSICWQVGEREFRGCGFTRRVREESEHGWGG